VSNPGSAAPTISANIGVTVPTTTIPNPVTHLGNTRGNNGRLDSLDDRFYQAMIRNGRMWAAHNFRVNAAGVANTAAAARNASRWYELQNLTTTPTVVQSGTVFDSAATLAAARQYWIPSVVVTGQGHAVLGITMAGTPVGATPAYVGRLSGDTLGQMVGPPMAAAATFGTTTANYNPASDPGGASGRRWGDYSFTVVDPLDDMTVWTIQEYNQALNSYAVRVGKLLAPPPAAPACSGSPVTFAGPAGTVVIAATSSAGSGFYDPGADLAPPALPFSHIAATVTNAIVNSVTYNSPTQVTLDITALATGSQNVTVTNPDGQSVTANGCINVLSAAVADLAITKTDGVATAVPGGSVTYTITASNATAFPAAGATVSGTKTASGAPFTAGSTVTYTVVLSNSGPGPQGDNPGNEFTDALPPGLALVSATATSGTAAANTGTGTATWNGSIPASGSVTVTITATILPAAAGTTVSNQGTIAYGSNGDGTNDATAQTDDPGMTGAANPTSIQVPAVPPVITIPALSTFGLLFLGLALAGLALALMRRRAEV